MYTITLADGAILKNLALNGNNFISDTPLDASIFENNLRELRINGPDIDETFKNLELASLREDGGKYWFVLRQLSDREMRDRNTQADIRELFNTSDDIILMMADLIGG